MDNYATINRKEFTEAFLPPKMKFSPKSSKGFVPQTTIIRGAGNILAVEGAFLEKTFTIEGKWKKQVELKTAEVYELLKNKLPKSETITIYLEESGKFTLQVDKLKVSINIVKT